MGKWDTQTAISGTVIARDDLVLVSDQSQTDGSQDRNATRSALSLAIPKYEVSETSHGLSVGDAVRFDGANYVAATADTAANAELIGLVVEVPDTDTLVFQQVGYTDTQSGLTAGEWYYLQDAGGLGTTAGTVEVPVLLADSTTSGWLVPLGSQQAVASLDDGTKSVTAAQARDHIDDTSNPHSVTAAQAGAVDLTGDTMTGNLALPDGGTLGSTTTPGAVTIASDGDVTFSGDVIIGTSGKGIDFSANTDDATPDPGGEVLDDYEEGTWTITGYDASSGGNATANTATGYYTKIGRSVHAHGVFANIDTTGLTGTNILYFSLPFTDANAPHPGQMQSDSLSWNGGTQISTYTVGVDRFRVHYSSDNGADGFCTVDDISSGTTDVWFNVTFEVS